MTGAAGFSSVFITASNALSAAQSAFQKSAASVARDAVDPTGDANLSADMVSLIKDEQAFSANAAVIEAANRMYGSLLDMFDTDYRR